MRGENLARRLPELGDGRSCYAVGVSVAILLLAEPPHRLDDAVQRDVAADVEPLERVVRRRLETVVALVRVHAHEFAMGLHETVYELRHLLLFRVHPLDVFKDHRDAPRVRLVFARKALRKIGGNQFLKMEPGDVVPPDRLPLLCAELLELDGVVEAAPHGIVQRAGRGVRHPDGRKPGLVQHAVDHALVGAAAGQGGEEFQVRPEKLVRFVHKHHAAPLRHLLVADADAGDSALRRGSLAVAVALPDFKEIQA